ncbi:hypothetical protein SAMN06264855_10646 [Halorubrum vacuolatum]|uniref:Uncharacterized protein n=2 Tax=Halorubrum vacuolatum TaxID=63740 RepID=A0A238W8R3_HALVU|nr:hypothetical protein SAMN06264855_10646 [Halorubrum vacuolatum]
MYKHFEILDDTEPYFEKGTVATTDKVFLHTVNSDIFSQRVVTIPVTCDIEPQTKDEDWTHFTCYNFDTGSESGEPSLLPKEEVREKLITQGPDFDEYVDAITFWIRFSTDTIPTYNGEGEFIFDLQTASEFGPVRHTYHFYTLPRGGTFGSSWTSPEIEYWSPMEDRTMFIQWEDEYGVEEATQTGTGSDRQMIRVRDGVRNEDSVTTRGDYKISSVKEIDDSLRDFLNITLAILGTLVIGAFVGGGQIFNFATVTVAVLFLIFLLVLVLNLYVRDLFTNILWRLFRGL